MFCDMSVDVSDFSAATPTHPVLERYAPAYIIHSTIGAFSARVTDIQPGRMQLLGIGRALPLRDPVTVLVFGQRIAAAISHSDQDSLAVEFKATPKTYEAIAAFEEFKHGDDSGGFDDGRATIFTDVTPHTDDFESLPVVDASGRLRPQSALDGLGMLLSLRAERPVMVRSGGDISKVSLCIGGEELEVRAIPVNDMGYLMLPPRDHTATDAAIARLRQALDRTHPTAQTTTAQTAYDDDLPSLSTDGTIAFRSYEQFLFQVESNLSRGAIMALGAAGKLGTRRALKLVIPNADPIQIASAELLFQDQGRVGFSVQHPKELRRSILSVVSQASGQPLPGRPAPTPAPVLRPAPTPTPEIIPVAVRVPLSPVLPTPQALIDFPRTPAHPLTDAGGWYLGVIDRALRLGQDVLITVSNDHESIRIWIYRGHIVAALRRPAPGSDRLGQRLIAKRAINGKVLRNALKVALNTKGPVGQIIIETGKVLPAQVNRALRYQLIDRITVPLQWTSGWVEVSEMPPLPVKTDLVALSRNAAIAHLVRQHLSKSRPQDLRDTVRRYLNQPLKVDLSHLSPNFHLTEREQQFIAKCANSEGALTNVIAQSPGRPDDAYRMLMLAVALGIVMPIRA